MLDAPQLRLVRTFGREYAFHPATTFFEIGQAEKWKNKRHIYVESVEKDHGRMRTRTKNAGANLAIIRHLVLNLFRLDMSRRKGGIHTHRILAASSDSDRANLLGLEGI